MRVSAPSFLWLLMVGLLIQAAPSLRADDEPKQEQVALRPGGDLTAEELATVLGAHVWKFDVSLPEGANEVSVSLHQRAKGMESLPFGTGMSAPLTAETKRQLLIAIVPLGGSLTEAEKVRVTIAGFGMVTSRTADNPLRGLGIGGPAGSAEPMSDGAFNLLGGYEGGTISMPLSNASRIIALQIESK